MGARLVGTVPGNGPTRSWPAEMAAISAADLDHEEEVIFEAELDHVAFRKYRCCECTLISLGIVFPVGCSIFAPLYACLGASSRREEAESWKLTLTPTALNFSLMVYGCGCCCKRTVTKTIPLDKIQDIQLYSDCCGDCCGFSAGPAQPWLIRIQTAGFSAPGAGAELTLMCLKDPFDFRSRVLAARRAIIGKSGPMDGFARPAAKDDVATKLGEAADASGDVVGSKGALATLDRLETLMREGLELYKATG
jgi:hypothetical protein